MWISRVDKIEKLEATSMTCAKIREVSQLMKQQWRKASAVMKQCIKIRSALVDLVEKCCSSVKMKCNSKKSFELETEIANFGNDDCEFDV